MDSWLVVILLGIIEGLTEFIPVSSTGHLLLAQEWLPPQSELFNVVIQCGAALALIPLFYRQLRKLAFGLREPENFDLVAKLTVAFIITGVGGLILKKLGMELPESALPVAWATFLGGVVMLCVERWLKGRTLADNVTWMLAIGIGFAQLVAAVFPGASRSGTTIILALALGLNRPRATEFSFLLGIPTLLAAGALEIYSELKKAGPDGPQEDWALLLLGTVVSAIVAFIVVKWLIRFVQSNTFTGFAIYRMVIGAIMLWYLWPQAS
jgi:undecaprenyl-diphosphatase